MVGVTRHPDRLQTLTSIERTNDMDTTDNPTCNSDSLEIYSEDAVDQAIANLMKWCGAHKDEFLDNANFIFHMLCDDDLDLAEMEDSVKNAFSIVFTEWATFEYRGLGGGCINQYLSHAEAISDRDRAILSELKDTEKFGLFRYDGPFDDGDGDMGILVTDTLDNNSFKIHSAYLRKLAVNRNYEPGSGLSIRVATLNDRAYYIGHFPAHDSAMVEAGKTVEVYRECQESGFPFIIKLATCMLSPTGMFNDSAVIHSVGSNN